MRIWGFMEEGVGERRKNTGLRVKRLVLLLGRTLRLNPRSATSCLCDLELREYDFSGASVSPYIKEGVASLRSLSALEASS